MPYEAVSGGEVTGSVVVLSPDALQLVLGPSNKEAGRRGTVALRIDVQLIIADCSSRSLVVNKLE